MAKINNSETISFSLDNDIVTVTCSFTYIRATILSL